MPDELAPANIAAAAMFGSYAAFQFLVTLYVQDSLGWSPIGMALAFLPAGLIVVASAPRIDRLLARVDTPVIILGGFIAFVAGYGLFLRARPGMSVEEQVVLYADEHPARDTFAAGGLLGSTPVREFLRRGTRLCHAHRGLRGLKTGIALDTARDEIVEVRRTERLPPLARNVAACNQMLAGNDIGR